MGTEAGLAILVASACVQLIATALALRLAWLTGQSSAWLLVAAAIGLMWVRRLVSIDAVLRGPEVSIDPMAEAIALAISVLMVLGLASIAPGLLSVRSVRRRVAQMGRILEDARDEIYVFDARSLRFLEVNRGGRENLGYSLQELRALTPVDLKPEFTPARFEAMLAPLRSGEQSIQHFETHHRRKDGSLYPVEVRLQLSRASEPPVFFAIVLDLTERQQAEQTRRRLEAAMAQAGEGIVVVDRSGRIEYANLAFARMMDVAPADALGLSIGDLAFGPADDSLLGQIAATIARGEPWHGRYESVWRDGSRHVRDASVAPVRSTTGEVEHLVGVLRDVTRETELERDLLHAQKMEAVGRLAGGVAHDFNNLLTVIEGYAATLRDGFEPASEQYEAALQIEAAAERAAGLTRQLLTFGRKTPAKARPIDPGALLGGMTGMLGRLIGEDVAVELALADTGWIEADPGQIEQAVLNLAANARDAMPSGGRLAIATREVAVGPADDLGVPPGRWVVVTVSDTGAGMDPETVGRAFDPFFTTKAPGRGTGLGLSAVYGIVRAAGGTVRLQSARGHGTTFELWFPRIEPEPAVGAGPEPNAGAVGLGHETILLVEDEPAVRRLAQRALERLGHRVLCAADGLEARALAERHEGRLDLLLTDVVMPGMSGFELARRLRERRPGLPVLVMSGYADPGVETGVPCARLAKPFTPEQLARAVRGALDETGGGSS